MRIALALLILLFAALGAFFGAMNSDSVDYDFYFAQVHLPKGAALLIALFIGWVLGGLLVYLGQVVRLRRRVRKLRAENDRLNVATASADVVTIPRDA